jgi:iron only hydrogenase large subunit-like protein
VAEEYLRLLEQPRWRTLIRSTCPVLVAKVRKDYPELVPYLAPVATPTEAEAAYLRKAYPGATIVHAGVCLGDAGTVADATVTFEELGALFTERGVDLGAQPSYHRRIPGAPAAPARRGGCRSPYCSRSGTPAAGSGSSGGSRRST